MDKKDRDAYCTCKCQCWTNYPADGVVATSVCCECYSNTSFADYQNRRPCGCIPRVGEWLETVRESRGLGFLRVKRWIFGW